MKIMIFIWAMTIGAGISLALMLYVGISPRILFSMCVGCGIGFLVRGMI